MTQKTSMSLGIVEFRNDRVYAAHNYNVNMDNLIFVPEGSPDKSRYFQRWIEGFLSNGFTTKLVILTDYGTVTVNVNESDSTTTQYVMSIIERHLVSGE